MPRYFFDIHDGVHRHDEEGTFCSDVRAAALEAKRLLPAIAVNEAPNENGRQIITVVVTDEEGHAVYSAALSVIGTWLLR